MQRKRKQRQETPLLIPDFERQCRPLWTADEIQSMLVWYQRYYDPRRKQGPSQPDVRTTAQQVCICQRCSNTSTASSLQVANEWIKFVEATRPDWLQGEPRQPKDVVQKFQRVLKSAKQNGKVAKC